MIITLNKLLGMVHGNDLKPRREQGDFALTNFRSVFVCVCYRVYPPFCDCLFLSPVTLSVFQRVFCRRLLTVYYTVYKKTLSVHAFAHPSIGP